ncbi:DUF418 domain-containing protein [Gellertiella hungarica]|uniref:Putative membrane protein YeiB n=1 Tax=Gellertiella hungarica TaxID=1572859 RepID=A0A7W6NJP9_9HYPH|nr:heparan-alpha-glucosaminide N-acetyltransferase domain-containing protein [Gellertiella hungarica]MBB4063610.1 putative membrane protein YeiB [Gellertiella hungarica]
MSVSVPQAYAPASHSGKQNPQAVTRGRLEGLDLARFIAFAGMVIVNFGLVLAADGGAHGAAGSFISLFEGRAAATFVVLAGIGFSLMTHDGEKSDAFGPLLKRAGFLMAAGLLNMLVFPADILHLYAVYFLLGLAFIRLPSSALTVALCLCVVFATAALFVVDYEAGWNWSDYSYADFWSAQGFLRNLMFNGFHPVLPWFGFMLFGFLLARLPLANRRMQVRMILLGLVTAGAAAFASNLLASAPFIKAAGLVDVVHIKPMPPGPLYVLSGLGTASVVIGLCLLVADLAGSRFRFLLAPFLATGRMTLSLYVGHILIGMLVLVLLGYENSGEAGVSLVATAVFVTLSVAFATSWMARFPAGPLEMLMRRLTG